jgi:hypothetical protein
VLIADRLAIRCAAETEPHGGVDLKVDRLHRTVAKHGQKRVVRGTEDLFAYQFGSLRHTTENDVALRSEGSAWFGRKEFAVLLFGASLSCGFRLVTVV